MLNLQQSGYPFWKWPIIISVGCFALILFHSTLTWATAQYGGTVKSFTCKKGDFLWKRGSVEKTVSKNARLHIGDTIFVKRKNCSIKLKLNNDQSQSLTIENKSYVVSTLPNDKGIVESIYKNASNWLSGLWGNSPEDEEEFIAAVRKIRKNELAILLLKGNKQTLCYRPGQRNFYVGWSAGVSPYKVSLKHLFGAVVAAEDRITGNTFMFEQVNLETGKYRVTVTDRHGSSASQRFSVIDSPNFYEVIQNIRQASPEEQIAWAHRFMTVRSKWGLEIYQLGAEMEDDLARRLKIVLEENISEQ